MGSISEKWHGLAQAMCKAAVHDRVARACQPGTPTVGSALVTRFGSRVDVRNRGAVRIRRLASAGGIGGTGVGDGVDALAPAVVRLWHAEHCDELTIAEARALAAQLIAAAALADGQNQS